MFIGFEEVVVDFTVVAGSSLTIPAKATHADLTASSDMVYTCDGTNPSVTKGMTQLSYFKRKRFEIQDLKNIKMIKAGVAAARVGIHYVAGRDI